MSKPRLFIDIDGVLYANYGGQWQLRPYIVTLTAWAAQHFDVYYLSFNSRRDIIPSVCYAPGEPILDWKVDKVDAEGNPVKDDRGFRVDARDWHPRAGGSEKLHAIREYGGLEGDWILIEDTPPNEDQIAILNDYDSLRKWLVIPDTGGDVLLDVKMALENYLAKGKLIVPFAWCEPVSIERDLCINAEWKGYGKHPRND